MPRSTKILQKNTKEYYNKIFALRKPLSLTNMCAFYNINSDELKKYNTPHEILDDFYPKRYELYQRRKEFLEKQYKTKVQLLQNKVRFMDCITNNVIDIKSLQQNKMWLICFQMSIISFFILKLCKIMRILRFQYKILTIC